MGEKGRSGRHTETDAPLVPVEEVPRQTEGERGRDAEMAETPEGGELGEPLND